jgi:hypothetical protein
MSFTHGMFRRHANRQRESPYGRANPSAFGERYVAIEEIVLTAEVERWKPSDSPPEWTAVAPARPTAPSTSALRSTCHYFSIG